MKVSELIEALKNLPQDAEVLTRDHKDREICDIQGVAVAHWDFHYWSWGKNSNPAKFPKAVLLGPYGGDELYVPDSAKVK